MKKDEFVEVMHPEKLGYTKNDRNLLNLVKYFYSAVPAFPQHQILTDQKSLTTLLINLH
jgi:hypothetical protein